MSWHYQVRHRVDKGAHLYDIVEVYTRPAGWTQRGIAPCGETVEELVHTLAQMQHDCQRFPVLEDLDPPVETFLSSLDRP